MFGAEREGGSRSARVEYLSEITVLSAFVAYVLSWVGCPYVWGGNHPATGIDCSGFALWCLRFTSFRIEGDATAQTLMEAILEAGGERLSSPREGALCFYGPSDKDIVHVAISVDSYRIVHAAGGDSRVKTIEDSRRRGAGVRGDRFNYRKDLAAIVMPPYTREL